MTRRNGPWTVRSSRVAYENPWVRVEHDEVTHPHGEPGVYGVVRFANLAIGVLPLFEDGTVPLVGQHRYPFDAYSWELPEGGGPKGEAPEAAALRELAEETGLVADHLLEIGRADLSNSVTDEQAVMFLAWGLTEGVATPDPDEVLEHRRVPFADLLAEVLSGAVTDAFTHLIVLTALARAQRGELPEAPTALILSAR
jgi:8-oxo-dGTP pyrophosphatase MutT (NUDIX family)